MNIQELHDLLDAMENAGFNQRERNSERMRAIAKRLLAARSTGAQKFGEDDSTCWNCADEGKGQCGVCSTPLELWRAIGEEAECVVQSDKKFLLLSEEMCIRLGAALESYAQPQPMTDAARERPSVVLAYSTKGHNKPCGQTMGANGCGEFVTVYYGDIDAAERSARDRICNLGKAGHRFNWAIVMRADEEAYLGPAMTFEEIERGEREGET